MKYYKLININGYGEQTPKNKYKLGKIYKGTDAPGMYPVVTHAERYPESWQECSELDYNLQEGIITELPEEYIVECNNTTEHDYVSNTYYKDNYNYFLNYKYLVCRNKSEGMNNQYYGDIPERFNHLPIFTYRQWKELMDKKEEFVLPEKWCIRLTPENIDIVGTWYNKQCNTRYYVIMENYPYLSSHTNSTRESIIKGTNVTNCRLNKPTKEHPEISFEQFKKYILKENNMEKKVIGYKLKDGCEQYKGAINQICNTINFDFKRCAEKSDSIQSGITSLKDAGVLTLWFDEVYKEEFKVGDYGTDDDGKNIYKITRITEYKVHTIDSWSNKSMWRKATDAEVARVIGKELYFGDVKFTIKQGNDFAETSHGNIPKSDLKKTIDYIENPPSLKGYNLKIYDVGEKKGYNIVDLDSSDNMLIAFGCTSGSFSDLVAIYNAFE